jgi:chemosensory pili system protein ChpA (sensor histidine kinase/response regulator)
MILQKMGLTVHVASDGMQALELIRAVGPALVMMDMQMPLMDGTEVLRAVRADASVAQPPVVFLSANRLSSAQEEELKVLEVADFLIKPVNRSRLQGVLVELLPKA